MALALTLPVIAAGSSLMTIDSPYTCCWGWALVLGHRAIFRGSGWAWPAAGLVVGLGILAKYTMVLWLPSPACSCSLSRTTARLLLRPGFWMMSAIAGLCCLPILIWNCNNDWVTFRHVDHLTRRRLPLDRAADYLGGQAALLLGYWFVVWVAAMVRHTGRWTETDAGVRYLWWMSAPMFLVFLAFSLKTGGGEPNWPVTAYLSGLVLAAGWLARQLASPRGWYRRSMAAPLAGACGLGLTATVLVHHTDWMRPLLASCPARRRRSGRCRCAASTRPAGCAAGDRWAGRWTRVRRATADGGGSSRSWRRRAGRCRASWASTATATRRPTRSAWRWATATASTTCGTEPAARPGGVPRADVHRRRLDLGRGEGGVRRRRAAGRRGVLRGGAADRVVDDHGLPRVSRVCERAGRAVLTYWRASRVSPACCCASNSDSAPTARRRRRGDPHFPISFSRMYISSPS